MARNQKWQGGYIDGKTGTFHIRQDVAGVTYKRSTRCTTLDGALVELARFEKDRAGYVPGGGPAPEKHSISEAVAGWLVYSAQVKGNSPGHVEKQTRYFATWQTFLGEQGVSHMEDVNGATVDAFIAWRRPLIRVRSEGSIRGAHVIALEVAALKVLFSWAARPASQGGFLTQDPLANYPIPRRPRGSSVPKVFTLEWWARIRPFMAEKWQMVGDVLLGSSMRYSSLARLRPDDVDTGRATIHLRGNAIKGKDGTTVYVSQDVAAKAKQLAVMVVPATSQGFDRELERAARNAGERYFSCHAFRHTSASYAVEDGLKGKDLQKRLAHARFATTELYIERLGLDRDAYRGRL